MAVEAPLAKEEVQLTLALVGQKTTQAVAEAVGHHVLQVWVEGRSSLWGAVAVDLHALVLGQTANTVTQFSLP